MAGRLAFIALLAVAVLPANAHFLLNLNVRIFHVEHRADGLDVYVRMPMPYLVADKTGPADENGLPAPAPYTSNRLESGKVMHFVDFAEVRRDPIGLGALLESGLSIVDSTGRLGGEVLDTRVYRLGTEPPFATLDEAAASFERRTEYPDDAEPVYVGDTIVDARIRYQTASGVTEYQLSSRLDPGLPGQENTANLVLDYGPGSVKVHRARGLLAEPIEISRSWLSAFFTFVKEGMRHILEGLDHVLFVLCIVVGATGLKGLLWRVTGFTIGHSVTLSLGFFGFVPSGTWFVPTVETAIALSIVYAAAIAAIPRFRSMESELAVVLVTSFIGLIHGLGFSFVLQNILKISSPDIWQSLLAFNLGIEIGQLVIVLATGILLWGVARISNRAQLAARRAIALASAGIALFWVVERSVMILA